jgi:hypothetical protein
VNIGEIYKEFGTPPNLCEHMLRVCGIVSFIESHWKGLQQVNWDLAKKAALLHDLGNVVRFDLDKHPEFLGNEQKNVKHWKEVQIKVIEKYGTDDHEATKHMLGEINASEELIEIILNKSFGNSITTMNSNNWPLKILSYADLRTLPQGIGTLDERLHDIRERMPKYSERPDFEDLVAASKENERQIQENIDMSLGEIKDTVVTIDVSKFSYLEF